MDQTAIRVFSIYGRLAPVSRSQQDCQQSGKDSGCPQNIEQTPRQTSAPIWSDHYFLSDRAGANIGQYPPERLGEIPARNGNQLYAASAPARLRLAAL